MKREQIQKSFLLALTALIWGSAFVAQSVGMDYVGPFTFSCVRTLIGGLVLIPCLPLLARLSGENPLQRKERLRAQRPTLIRGGILCGICLMVASMLQQYGMLYTTAGKAGFITALYIVLVPVLGLAFGKKASWMMWVSVAIAVVGMYLLCVNEDFTLGQGDLLLILCALVFTLHIWTIDYFSPRVDGVRMAMIQFFVCSILCAGPMLWLEKPTLSAIYEARLPILYAGALSCGVAYTLQIVGQKNMNPTVASLILSLESVFAVLTGWLILGEHLSAKELAGCALMFAAILLAQMPVPVKRGKGITHGEI